MKIIAYRNSDDIDVQFLDEIAQEIVNSIKEFRRHDTEKEIIESRFNIKKEVIKLEEKYCELLDMADMKIRK